MAGITVTGLPGALKAIEGLTGQQLQNALRRGVRAAGRVFQADMKSVAAGADVPRSFTRVPAPRMSTHGGASGRDVAATVRPTSPLFNIFEPGAKSHTIAPRRAAALGGRAGSGSWDTTGRKRRADFFSAGPVAHPGMRAHPILPATFAMGHAAASDALAAVLFGGKGGTG